MPPLVRIFQDDHGRNICTRGQGMRRHERVVDRIYNEGRHLNVLEPWFAARLIPIVLRITKTMERCGYEIIELIQRSAGADCGRIEQIRKEVKFSDCLALERIKKMARVEQIEAGSQSIPRSSKIEGHGNGHDSIDQPARLP